MVMKACKLELPQTESPLVVSSLLYEPISHCLALMRSDSSLLLYPPFSLSFPSPPPPPPTLIPPPPSTAFSFIRFHPNPNPDSASRLIFLAARPHAAGSSILLRAWFLIPKISTSFSPACIDFNRNHTAPLEEAVIALSHGFSIKIEGSVNFFALYSASARKIWLLSVKLRDGDACLDLIKCAAIECTAPIYSLAFSAGLLLLGEVHGVRVFPLRPLVKGRAKKRRNLDRKFAKKQVDSLQNGVIGGGSTCICDGSTTCSKDMGKCYNPGGSSGLEGVGETSSSSCKERPDANHISGELCIQNHVSYFSNTAKRRTVKLRQDSGELGSIFAAFKCSEVQSQNCLPTVTAALKAVSIHSLSQQRFLILDSNGDLHLFCLHNTATVSEVSSSSCVPLRVGCMRRLSYTMKVQMLAVVPDISAKTHTIWMSDGCYSVHIMSSPDIDIPTSESITDGSEETLMQNSAVRAIFTSEKIEDVIPYSANGVLILGQGNIFAYGIA